MNTFKAAFKVALIDAGFQPQKVTEILTVWQEKGLLDRPRLATPNAVVAVVRRDVSKR